MVKRSAGVLLFRRPRSGGEVLLVHPGGPFWAKRDAGAWSIPKGVHDASEDALAAAKRELYEETGLLLAGDGFIPLGDFRQPSGKIITAFAREGDFDPGALTSNSCMVEWPPRSRHMIEVPEVDRADWFSFDTAFVKIIKGQAPILRALAERISVSHDQGGCVDL